MKQLLLITILITAFCFTDYAQSDEKICPKIKINAPEYIQLGETAKISAFFEKEIQPSKSKFNWTIIKEDTILRFFENGSIGVNSDDMIKEGTIILLVDSLNKACSNTVVAKINVLPKVGSPLIFDEYSKLKWNEEQARLKNILYLMNDNKTDELFIFLSFEKTASQIERKTYLTNLLNYLTGAGKLEKNRISFLISEERNRWIKFQPVPKDAIDVFLDWDDSLLIKGEDFDKLINLFQPTLG